MRAKEYRFMKKILSVVIALLLMGTVCAATACSGGATLADPDDYEVGQVDVNIEATLDVACLNTTQEKELMQDLAKGFQAIYKNVKFRYTTLTDYEAGIAQEIVAGTQLDVIWVPDAYVTSLADEGLLYNLDKYIEETGFDTSLYDETMMALGKYKHGTVSDASQYFLPRDYSKIVTYINRNLVEKYAPDFDLDYYVENQDEWTWEAMLSLCAQLKSGMENETNKPYIIESMWQWMIQFYGMVESYGGTYLNPETGEAVLDDGFKQALESIKQLIDAGYTKYDSDLTELSRFHFGQAVLAFQSRPYLATAVMLDEEYGADCLEVLPFPAIGENPKVGTGTTGYGICTSTKNADLAWEFLRFMMSKEGQTILASSGKAIPSMNELREGENASWKQFEADYNYNREAFLYAPERDIVQSYYDMISSAKASQHEKALKNSIFENYWGGNMSIEDAIDHYKQAVM